jgi:hypothetical protein
MADNVAITAGSGTTVRTKDRGGIETQVVIVDWNTAGSETLAVPTFATTSIDGGIVSIGATGDAAVTTNTTGTLSGKIRGIVALLAAALPTARGQQTMANSMGVTLASDQSALNVAVVQASSGGTLLFRNTALKATATAVKASAGGVYAFDVHNLDGAEAWLHFYDLAAASVVVGTTTPVWTVWVPASGAKDQTFMVPLKFTAAIAVAATTTIGGLTAPTNGELVNIAYY